MIGTCAETLITSVQETALQELELLFIHGPLRISDQHKKRANVFPIIKEISEIYTLSL